MYALASPELLYVSPHFDADIHTPYVPLTNRGGLSLTGREEANITSREFGVLDRKGASTKGQKSNIMSAECGFLEEGGVPPTGQEPDIALAERGFSGEGETVTANANLRECGPSKGGEDLSASDSSNMSVAAANAPPTLYADDEGLIRSRSRPPPLRVGFVSKFFGDEVRMRAIMLSCY